MGIVTRIGVVGCWWFLSFVLSFFLGFFPLLFFGAGIILPLKSKSLKIKHSQRGKA